MTQKSIHIHLCNEINYRHCKISKLRMRYFSLEQFVSLDNN